MDILIGTKNEYKATEMISFLGNIPGVTVYRLEDLNLKIKVEEDQFTLRKNAEKKAKEISELTDWYVLTSDGGVDLPGLGDKWDILRNQRIVGEDKTDLEKALKLLLLMKDIKGEARKAEYHLVLAIGLKGRVIWSTEQITDIGYISEKLVDSDIPKYRWMGHLWYYPKHKKVFNKLTEEQKDDVRKIAAGIKKSLRKNVKKLLTSTA